MTNKKLKYLDGIRGLMAINVIICHFIAVYYPQMHSQSLITDASDNLAIFATSPLSMLVNGNIAVQYFFVLSGFLVGRSVLMSPQLGESDIIKKCCNRYLRLLPICVMATLFTLITMIANLQYHLDLVGIAHNGAYMKSYCNFDPAVLDFLMECFINPFVKGSKYVGPFWTIKYELWGYVLVLLTAVIFKKSKLRRVAYIIVAGLVVLKVDNNYLGFFAGLFVADVVYLKEHKTTVFSPVYSRWLFSAKIIPVFCVIGLYFASCPLQFSGVHKILGRIPVINTSLVRAMGCSILVFCLTQSKCIYKIFEVKPLLHLGELSYPIYAFHWPLMLTLEAGLFKLLVAKTSYDVAAVSSFLITVFAIVLVAYLVSVLERKMHWNVNKLIDKTTIEQAYKL